MTTKPCNLIGEIRTALSPKYEFPYYALVRIRTRHYGTIHIPAPFFDGTECNPRSQWAGSLTITQDKRDWEYFVCPCCGEKSFFSGICDVCQSDFEEWDDTEEQWVTGVMPIEYRNHVALKASVKDDILYRIDHGIQDLGIVSAEIVLSIVPSNVCDGNDSPFLKSGDWSAKLALNRIEIIVNIHESLKEREEYQKMLREFQPNENIPLDYIEGDVIEVEGTDEKRKYMNKIWWHMHGEYEYWHPMARVHKESMEC